MAGNIAIFVPHSGCPNLCSFCNQRVISGSQSPPCGADVVDICSRALGGLRDKTGSVEIAFFGGSFTAIPQSYMQELLTAVQPFLADERISGIRVSTRPDAIDNERLSILKKHGVTAIELGAQSMNDTVLVANRRGHTAADVVAASKLIKSAGFELGLQMMTGLYCSDENLDYATAVAIADLAPDTARIYPTVVLHGTELAQHLATGLYSPPGVEASIHTCARIADLFAGRGIRILRLGLHASESMESEIIGGCYHPAFGELVAGERHLTAMESQMQELGGQQFSIRVKPRLLSQVLGQHKRNIAQLQQKGYNVTYTVGDADMVQPFIIEKRGEG